MRITYSIDLAGKPDEVFPWIAEPEKAIRWQQGVKGGEILEKTPERTGTTFTEILEEGGKSLEMVGVITGYVPNKLIAFQLDSRIHEVDVSYAVQGTGNRTTIAMESIIRWKFPMNIMSIFIGRKIRDKILKQTEAEFAELSRLCQTEPAASQKQ